MTARSDARGERGILRVHRGREDLDVRRHNHRAVFLPSLDGPLDHAEQIAQLLLRERQHGLRLNDQGRGESGVGAHRKSPRWLAVSPVEANEATENGKKAT
jgi:hypothetical protein